MKFKSLKKICTRKKTKILSKLLISGLLVGMNSIAFAADDSTIEDEPEDNEYSYQKIRTTDDSIYFYGFGQSYGGSYTFNITGGSGHGNFAYNELTVDGGIFTFNIDGGSYNGNVYNNTLDLNNGALSINISNASSYSGSIYNNNINITGGTFSNNYVSLPSVTATGNTITISGNPNLSDSYIYGGLVGATGSSSNNTLNVNTTGITAKNIYNFETVNFNLPSNVSNGDTVLYLTESSTDISSAPITAVVRGDTTLTEGNTIQLMSNSNGISTSGNFTGKFAEGVTLTYEPILTSDSNNVYLTLGEAKVEEQTRALNQPILDSVSVLGRGTDRLLEWLPPEEFSQAAEEDDEQSQQTANQIAAMYSGFEVFANTGGSNIKTKTGNGSYVKNKGGSIDLGISRAFKNSAGTLIIAPLVDYGKGKYDSYLNDGLHGSGDSKYIAGGVMLRQINNNGFYYEGSFRGGRAETNFASGDFKMGENNVGLGYNASTPVFSGHVRVGKLLKMNKNNLLHVYGIYSHNHQNSMDTHLSTGERYDFDSVDNGKFRLGYRLTSRVSPISQLYTGLAYQYEFTGETSSTYRGYKTPSEEIKGSSGMLELGWQIKANRKIPWVLDINATGWIGQQKGVTATAKIKKSI